MTYCRDHVLATDGTVILLKFVESMRFNSDPIDQVVDALKGDVTFNIVTISGKEYIISAGYNCLRMLPVPTPANLAKDVYSRWKYITRYKE